jgi:hypothetical protein
MSETSQSRSVTPNPFDTAVSFWAFKLRQCRRFGLGLGAVVSTADEHLEDERTDPLRATAHLRFDLVPASRLPITAAPMPSPRSASVAGSGTVTTCCACGAACEGSCDGPPCRPRCAESIDPDRSTVAATRAIVTTVRIWRSPLRDRSTTTTLRFCLLA